LSGTKHNVFGIQTGVAITLLVRRPTKAASTIRYIRRPEDETAEDKLAWLSTAHLGDIESTTIRPNERSDWLHTDEIEGWDEMLPVGNPETKAAKDGGRERAIFKLYSLGVVTARDEWVYDWSDIALNDRLPWFLARYEAERLRLEPLDKRKRREAIEEHEIKLTRALKNDLVAGTELTYNAERNRDVAYRPFVRKRLHFWSRLNEMQYQLNHIFPDIRPNPTIAFRCVFSNDPLATLAVQTAFDYGLLKTGNGGTDSLPRYRYSKAGERVDNVTNWALNKFVAHYGKRGVTKDAIFNYVYAILHDPLYREQYAQYLKREFPRVPFYPDFARWAAWGESLMTMHIGYEDVDAWPIERVDTKGKRAEGMYSKPILRSQPEEGIIVIDGDTKIVHVPREAWEYRLANRSAIDWVLDQHREKRSRDPTIAARFDVYRFADRKDEMITLLSKVISVSVQTVRITSAMKAAKRK
jgi:predicted helicase